jgi:hypothetical protein
VKPLNLETPLRKLDAVSAGASLKDVSSIAASFARKLFSTRWASTVVSVFLSGNRRWTQSAASSAELSPLSSQLVDPATLRMDRN